MGIYSEKAIEFFKSGCCCSQAVVCAFEDRLGTDAEQLKADAVIYRGGKRDICGAAMGARAVINYMNGVKDRSDPARDDIKTAEKTALMQQLFKEKIGEDRCREIKSRKLRSCVGCVEDAATMLEQLISEGKI